MFLSVIIAGLCFLSMLGAVSISLYLYLTERKAPRFPSEISQIEPKDEKTPLVSIIVTAKNEEHTIGRCLESIMSQSYRNIEIIVIDDGSTDGTVKAASELASRDPRLRVVSAGPKPSGWAGKSWPCQRGFGESRGEKLLFVDADSFFDKKALEMAVNYIRSQSIEMFSISPRVLLKGIWSRATMPLLVGAINLLYPLSKVNDPQSKRAYVFGTFILVTREAYVSIGGHEAVKQSLVEDAAIARLAKASGFKLRVERSEALGTTEWETGARTIFRGLERVFSDSIRPYGAIALLNAVVVFFLAVFPLLVIFGFLYLHFTGGSYAAISFETAAFMASITNVIALLATVSRELRQIAGKIGAYPFLYPLGCVIFILAIVSASFKISRKGSFEWKGSSYSEA